MPCEPSAAVHSNDTEAREWCVTMLAVHREVDLEYLEHRASEEGLGEALRAVRQDAEALASEGSFQGESR